MIGIPKVSVPNLEKAYPLCYAVLGRDVWDRMIGGCKAPFKAKSFSDFLAKQAGDHVIPEFLPELAGLEWARHSVSTAKVSIPKKIDAFVVNPTLEIQHLSWKLSSLLSLENGIASLKPQKEDEWALIWRNPESGEISSAAASAEELLVLKIVVEELTPEEAASGKVSVKAIYGAMARASKKGLIISPRSRIRRDTSIFPQGKDTPDCFVTADTFTLQWHITNACDLHCKHCYDRSKRSPPTLEQALEILDDLNGFCRSRRVAGHVCLSGGNPFLYPHFFELYRASAERGFSTSILANPVTREQIEKVIAIQRPTYFQVSLEGLQEHNDEIRGQGHFCGVMEFLRVLRDLEVLSAVMLTLTKDNIHQVLPLAEILRERTDHFTFNRLSQVGEGARLQLPPVEKYAEFLASYVDASNNNPIMGFKDNLINLVFHQRGIEPFDGCTGYGCGAAFNFLVILPDGETHACRKFQSPVGNILKQNFSEIYDSDIAGGYRNGARACRGCRLRPVCGGCLAVAKGQGLDIFEERDPYCFKMASKP